MSRFIYENIYIDYSESTETVKVTNFSNLENLRVWFTDVDKNWCPYPSDNLKKNHWISVSMEKNKPMRLYLGTPNLVFNVFDLLFKDENFSVTKINKKEFFDFNNEIIFVTGHSGGGTSIVSKALRMFDIHFGDDCGDLQNRKAHESVVFRLFIRNFSDKNELYNLRSAFNEISNVYGYKKNVVNCVKITNIEKDVITIGEIFPKCKFLSVVRKQDNIYTTKQGERFNLKSENEIMKSQFFSVEGNPVFHLDFYKFFSDFYYFNKVLIFLGSDNRLRNQEELEKLKEDINFDEKVLVRSYLL